MRPWRSDGWSIQCRQVCSGTDVRALLRSRTCMCMPSANITSAVIAIAIMAQPPDTQIPTAWSKI